MPHDPTDGGGSEVARMRRQIEMECEALQHLTSGLAVTAPHSIIRHRYEQLGQAREHLAHLVGEGEATAITMQVYTRVLEHDSGSELREETSGQVSLCTAQGPLSKDAAADVEPEKERMGGESNERQSRSDTTTHGEETSGFPQRRERERECSWPSTDSNGRGHTSE